MLLRVVFVSEAKPVTLPSDSKDVAGMLRVRFYFLPQAAYGRVDPTCLLLIPYIFALKPFFHDGAACAELPSVVIKVEQHVKF